MVRDPFYQVAELRRYAQAIGWPAAMRLRYCDVQVRTGLCKPFSLELKLKNSEFPVLMRTHTSDRDVLRQVFIQGGIAKRWNSRIQRQSLTWELMWALRAHISYPNTRPRVSLPLNLIQETYEVCCRNLAPFGRRAKVIHGAAWAEMHKTSARQGRL